MRMLRLEIKKIPFGLFLLLLFLLGLRILMLENAIKKKPPYDRSVYRQYRETLSPMTPCEAENFLQEEVERVGWILAESQEKEVAYQQGKISFEEFLPVYQEGKRAILSQAVLEVLKTRWQYLRETEWKELTGEEPVGKERRFSLPDPWMEEWEISAALHEAGQAELFWYILILFTVCEQLLCEKEYGMEEMVRCTPGRKKNILFRIGLLLSVSLTAGLLWCTGLAGWFMVHFKGVLSYPVRSFSAATAKTGTLAASLMSGFCQKTALGLAVCLLSGGLALGIKKKIPTVFTGLLVLFLLSQWIRSPF